jgi:hypothetical protein
LIADAAHRGNGVGGLSETPEHRYLSVIDREEAKFSALIKELGLKPQ